MVNNYLILCLISYLIGSIPFALIITKLSGFGDIRKIGSGNIGATNVLRTGKKTLAFIVLILDTLKGSAPLFIIKVFDFENFSILSLYAITSFAILGHMFPIWLKFKGGKGIATLIGYLFANNYLLGIIFVLSWLFFAIISKYSSLASILSIIVLNITAIFLIPDFKIIVIFFVISFIIVVKHYSNILRLFNKSENQIRF